MVAPAQDAQSAPALRVTSFPQLIALASERRDVLTKAALEADVRLVRIEDGGSSSRWSRRRRAALSPISPANWNNGPAGAGP
jgi:DNA polymerase-3 subunit gamma/tau